MRVRLDIRGLVQGVGFRPFVHQLATQHRLTGFVHNSAHGVCVEVQGSSIDSFVAALLEHPPPLSRIDRLEMVTTLPDELETTFSILESVSVGPQRSIVGVDLAPCESCLTELYSPSQRRFHYPFTNCTHCGPRYTIVSSLPYDRARTTLRHFPLCAACLVEYHDPSDRRFHAQPMACPDCGPQLSHALSDVAQAISDGKIVALKGLGGYHLVCDATQAATVQRLRERKQRDEKPLAVLVPSVESARHVAQVSDADAQLLQDPRRPIVLLPKRTDCTNVPSLAPEIAIDLSTVGIVLPMSPLHDLLCFYLLGCPTEASWRARSLALVLTSGNLHDEPTITDDDDAHRKLATVADVIVSHSRPIAARCDDSVVKTVTGQRLWMRRARGLTLEPIALPVELPPLLGLGGDLKSALCLTRGKEAFVSSHIGDLGSPAMASAYRETLAHMQRLLDCQPEAVFADRHPDFVCRRLVADLNLPMVEVSHHHAHALAVLAEHGGRQKALALVLDGFGLGDDGSAWGGELLLLSHDACRRVGHLRPLPQPGGDRASREPWRLATGVLAQLGLSHHALKRFGSRWPVSSLIPVVNRPQLSPPSSACGRYFQTAAALLGLREVEHYEGEAAMVLESQVVQPQVLSDGWTIQHSAQTGLPELDFSTLWRALLDCTAEEGAGLFHGTMAAGLSSLALRALADHGLSELVLTGGCVVNAVLTDELVQTLRRAQISVLLPRRMPPGDGALSLGQVFAAATRLGR